MAECFDVTSENGVFTVKSCNESTDLDSINDTYNISDETKTAIKNDDMEIIKKFATICWAMNKRTKLESRHNTDFLPCAIFLLCLGKVAFEKEEKGFKYSNNARRKIIADALTLGEMYKINKDGSNFTMIKKDHKKIDNIRENLIVYQFAYLCDPIHAKLSRSMNIVTIDPKIQNEMSDNCKYVKLERGLGNAMRVLMRDCPKIIQIPAEAYKLSNPLPQTKKKIGLNMFKISKPINPIKYFTPKIQHPYTYSKQEDEIYEKQNNVLKDLNKSDLTDDDISKIMYDVYVHGQDKGRSVNKFEDLSEDEKDNFLIPYIVFKSELQVPQEEKKGGSLLYSTLLKYQ